MTPVCSVIIPCYNSQSTVAETIASVAAQTLHDIEIIVVNDGSTDASLPVLQEIAKTEPRLRVLSQANKGLAGARNSGLSLARAPFMALIDADDLWPVDFLASHVARLEADARLGVSFSAVEFIDAHGRPTGERTKPKLAGLSAADFLASNPCTALVIFRREVLASVGGFNESLRRVEDQEWLFRVAHYGWTISGVRAPCALYRISPSGLAADLDQMLVSFRSMRDVAAKLAPELVARHGVQAQAHIYKFLARRALRLNYSNDVVRSYILKAIMSAPSLVWREPKGTLAPLVAAVIPGARALIYPQLSH